MGVLRDNLEPTDFASAVCRVSDWKAFGHYGLDAVRVWLCNCNGHWFQRHEWQEAGKNETKAEAWTYSGFSLTRRFPPHMVQCGLALLRDMAR